MFMCLSRGATGPQVQRPGDVPPYDADLVVVLSVDPKSEAETLGIQATYQGIDADMFA